MMSHLAQVLWCRAEYPNARRLLCLCSHCEQQPIQFWNKERRARAGHRRNTCNLPVCAVRFRVENIEEPLAAADIDALAFRIKKKIVGIAAHVCAGQECAVLDRECGELRG